MGQEKRTYKNAASFRQALEARLGAMARTEGVDLERLRKQVAFDCFLARIFVPGARHRWFLKGGYAMELRFRAVARATKDIDITIPDMPWKDEERDRILALIRHDLQDLCDQDIGDWFVFLVAGGKPTDSHPCWNPRRNSGKRPIRIYPRIAGWGKRTWGWHSRRSPPFGNGLLASSQVPDHQGYLHISINAGGICQLALNWVSP